MNKTINEDFSNVELSDIYKAQICLAMKLDALIETFKSVNEALKKNG
jgi:hypothetical protein